MGRREAGERSMWCGSGFFWEVCIGETGASERDGGIGGSNEGESMRVPGAS